MNLKLMPLWHRTNDVYFLNNDQKMKNVDNLISPSKKVVSVFLIEEEKNLGLYMFDRMLKDYKNITTNLRLLQKGKLKIKESVLPVYIIREKISKNAIVHLFFEKEDKLYVLIFSLDSYEGSITKTVKENPVFLQVLKLLEANL